MKIEYPSEENTPPTPTTTFDADIIAELQQKHKQYFDDYNQRLEEQYGEYFNTPLTAEVELGYYFTKLELRDDLLQDKTILDIGSSFHFFDEYCRKKYNATVVALDINRENLGDNHELGVAADARALPFKSESFDVIVSNDSMPIELIPYGDDVGNYIPLVGERREKSKNDTLSVFRETYRVLKKGGQARMSTISEKSEINAYSFDEDYEKFSEVNENPQEAEDAPNTAGVTHEDPAVLLQRALDGLAVIKEALEIFENESGAQCIFKDKERGGLIIIMK